MRRNMGTADRILRTVVAAPLLVVLAFLAGPGSVLGIVLLVLAGVMVATSAVSTCPLYPLVGLSTCPRREPSAG